MGNKYGSIHIKTNTGQQIAQEILKYYDNQPNEDLLLIEWLEKMPYEAMHDFAKTLRRYATILQDELFIVITDEWVSLYNRDMSFQTITSKARSLARKFSEPILYTSNFDDDVFVFGLIHVGKTVTSGRICDAPDIYGLTTKAVNMTALRRVLGVDSDKPRSMPTDIFELEELLTSMTGVPLFADQDDLYRDPEHFEQVEERNGICVYRKRSST